MCALFRRRHFRIRCQFNDTVEHDLLVAKGNSAEPVVQLVVFRNGIDEGASEISFVFKPCFKGIEYMEQLLPAVIPRLPENLEYRLP